ncbi:MAG TPA: DUF3300 domain-containing protein, partial [Candidatus Binatia bacterium]
MKTKSLSMRALAWLMAALMAWPTLLAAQQQPETAPPLKPEEIEQLVAPIALHPDDLISQILMASTYPIEVVIADRWVKQNSKLTGDALTAELEKQDWDPSVKSLVAFPQVLTMMSDKLDWTTKLGDAFLADQKKVLDTIQSLRQKAQSAGNLKTTKEQKVIVEQQVIKIEPANPEVIYVPTYNPTVVYGAWPYPAYPPYSYYPPGYVAGSMMWWGAGMAMGAAMGAAWGYGWGNCDWHGGNVKINNNNNININNKIDRGKYANQLPAGGKGNWQHNADHRKGASYRDQGTAQKFNRASTSDQMRSREQYRGRADQGRQDLANRGGAAGDRAGAGNRATAGDRAGTAGDRGGGQGIGGGDRAGQGAGGGNRANVSDRTGGSAGNRASGGSYDRGSSSRGGAFSGSSGGGSSARSASSRGSMSRGGGGGGGARGGGGGGGG